MSNLQKKLQKITAEAASKLSPEVIASLQKSIAELQQKVADQQSLGVGDIAPGFSLPNAVGDFVDSRELLASGPLVIIFYRGTW